MRRHLLFLFLVFVFVVAGSVHEADLSRYVNRYEKAYAWALRSAPPLVLRRPEPEILKAGLVRNYGLFFTSYLLNYAPSTALFGFAAMRLKP